MPVIAKCLVEAKAAEAAQTTQYTAPTATRVIVDKFTATNTGAATGTLAINVVPNGATAGGSNLIVQEKALTAGAADTLPEMVGQVLNPGDFISTLASAAGIVIRISGREITA
ncbi:hypothetical protein [Kerstersia gyiorum]|uniref:hypothetical protein n=1 Tax=Kerstersia gyiorum TaxID=206506 RepID=UPI00209F67F0|nr:hypothetical protein [Kerstersia gyiorum]MCP1679412.1 hypothetical protein [Kerstersia gyiorum]MCP1823915.1 hypothetical protein [Kerstersia gyiorum]MCP1827356.1 hypothetical protein [Kerstersia gyiorum]MCW2448995.1 hypothetical protein [Kerstersia gyiorum]